MQFGEFVDNGFKILRGYAYSVRFNSVGKLLRVGRGVRILKKRASITLGSRVCLHRYVKLSAWGTDNFAEIKIGDCTYIGDRTEIHAGKSVTIGSGCDISWDCNILDRDYHKINSDTETYAPVVICDNVWIGCRSIILKGVTIGEGAVVAAGSVVTHDVPPHTLVAGNPARVVREGITWKP